MNQNSTVILRSQQLKAATHNTHDSLDKRVMAADIFASRDSFTRFLRVQYRFHRDIDALYSHQGLLALIPDLAERRRLPKIALDLQDLGSDVPAHSMPLVDANISLEEINRKLRLDLQAETSDRLAGWITEHLGSVPKQDDVVQSQGVRVRVMQTIRLRVTLAHIEKLDIPTRGGPSA